MTSALRDSPTVIRMLRARMSLAHLHVHVTQAQLEMARSALVLVIGYNLPFKRSDLGAMIYFDTVCKVLLSVNWPDGVRGW